MTCFVKQLLSVGTKALSFVQAATVSLIAYGHCHLPQRAFNWLADQQGFPAVREEGSAGCMGARFCVSLCLNCYVAWLQSIWT